MLAGTAVYVNAGTQLAKLEACPASFRRRCWRRLRCSVCSRCWRKRRRRDPARKGIYRLEEAARFDRNLVVIGAGAGRPGDGLHRRRGEGQGDADRRPPHGRRLPQRRLRAVEGADPQRAIHEARCARPRRSASPTPAPTTISPDHGARAAGGAQVEPHDSVERYTGLGVEVIQGHARITSPWTVEVNGRQALSTRAIVIATGAQPVIPKIPGIESVRHVTSDSIWSLTEKPERLLVLGGGPIGCELAQAFAGIGCQVTLLARRHHGQGGRRTRWRWSKPVSPPMACHVEGTPIRCAARSTEGEQRLIVRARRHRGTGAGVRRAALRDWAARPRVSGFGLEELGIPLTQSRHHRGQPWLQTRYPNIYACGDVAGPYQFTHTAAHQAWYAAVNALFAGIKSFKADYSVIPWVTFTSPEVARVGLSETEAQARGIAHEVTRYDSTTSTAPSSTRRRTATSKC
jgi:thioredoxin reductase